MHASVSSLVVFILYLDIILCLADEKHDIIATEQDGDLEPHEERKW